ncbi:hypothetical protein DMUE_3484 [Dictyocoela muelleri]|nr:hypothetical protein DMUE_3484 [Dictyocoela muelleri]
MKNKKIQKIKINDCLIEIHEIKKDPLEIIKSNKNPIIEETPLKRPKSKNTSKSLRKEYTVKRTVSQWKNMNKLVDIEKRCIKKSTININTARFERLRQALENAEREKETRTRIEPSLEEKLTRKMEGDSLYNKIYLNEEDELYSTPLFKKR